MILGSHATVTGATNRTVVGLNGTITDETRHMIILETAGGAKMIPKKYTTMRVGELQVHGMEMRGRLHERLTGP